MPQEQITVIGFAMNLIALLVNIYIFQSSKKKISSEAAKLEEEARLIRSQTDETQTKSYDSLFKLLVARDEQILDQNIKINNVVAQNHSQKLDIDHTTLLWKRERERNDQLELEINRLTLEVKRLTAELESEREKRISLEIQRTQQDYVISEMRKQLNIPEGVTNG